MVDNNIMISRIVNEKNAHLAQCLEIKSSFSVVDEEQFIPDLE
jgi:hypothetical protein